MWWKAHYKISNKFAFEVLIDFLTSLIADYGRFTSRLLDQESVLPWSSGPIKIVKIKAYLVLL